MKVECAKLRRFNENHLSIKVKGKWGVVDPNNNVVTDFIYENDCRMRFSEGFAPVQKDKKGDLLISKGKCSKLELAKNITRASPVVSHSLGNSKLCFDSTRSLRY